MLQHGCVEKTSLHGLNEINEETDDFVYMNFMNMCTPTVKYASLCILANLIETRLLILHT